MTFIFIWNCFFLCNVTVSYSNVLPGSTRHLSLITLFLL